MSIPLPNCRISESALIVLIMRDSHSLDKINHLGIEEKDFFNSFLGKVFKTISIIKAKGGTPDNTTLKSELGKNDFKTLNDLKLEEKNEEVLRNDNIEYHGKRIKHLSAKRSIIKKGNSLIKNLYNNETNDSLEEAVNKAVEELYKSLPKGKRKTDLPHYGTQIIKDLQAEEDGSDGTILTGFPRLNSYLKGGFKPQKLVVLAAESGGGKSALAGQFALNASKQNKIVGFISLEMSGKNILERLLKAESPSYEKDDHCKKMDIIKKVVNKEKILICDEPSLNISEIESQCRQWQNEKGRLDFIIIDYLGIIKMIQKERGELEHSMLMRTSYEVKEIAKSLNCPILLLAQFNRKMHEEGVPQLEHLKGSSGIGNAADIVLGIQRGLKSAKSTEFKPGTILHLLKNRNGKKGEAAYFNMNEEGIFCDRGNNRPDLRTIEQKEKDEIKSRRNGKRKPDYSSFMRPPLDEGGIQH